MKNFFSFLGKAIEKIFGFSSFLVKYGFIFVLIWVTIAFIFPSNAIKVIEIIKSFI